MISFSTSLKMSLKLNLYTSTNVFMIDLFCNMRLELLMIEMKMLCLYKENHVQNFTTVLLVTIQNLEHSCTVIEKISNTV